MRSAPLLPAKLAEPLCAATIRSNDVFCDAPVEEGGGRDREAAVLRHDLVDAHERVRLRKWQRAQQHAVDHAEHRAGGADAERQGEDGHHRERGILGQLAHAVACVAQDIGQHLEHSSCCGVRHFDAVGQALHPGPRVCPFRQPDVARQLFPVADLAAGMGIGVCVRSRRRPAPRDRSPRAAPPAHGRCAIRARAAGRAAASVRGRRPSSHAPLDPRMSSIAAT